MPLEEADSSGGVSPTTMGALAVGRDGTLWAELAGPRDDAGVAPHHLVRHDDHGWSVFALAGYLPGSDPSSSDIAMDADGSVVLLVGPDDEHATQVDASGAVVRFDRTGLTPVAAIGSEVPAPSMELAPDGSI